MADNFENTGENTDSFDDSDNFDLDSELMGLTSFLQEMGVEMEDEDETGEDASPEQNPEDSDFPENVLDEFLYDQDKTAFPLDEEDDEVLNMSEMFSGSEIPNRSEIFSDSEIPNRSEIFLDSEILNGSEIFSDSEDLNGSEIFSDSEDLNGSEIFSGSEILSGPEISPDSEYLKGQEISLGSEALTDGEEEAEEDASAPENSLDEKDRKKVEKEVDKVLRKTFGRPFSWKREVISWVAMFVIAFGLAFVIDNYLIVNATVPTGSMQNTIMAGDRMIGWRLSYLFSDPERGDIIIFEYPDNPEEIYVKRVIGLPGETVTITDGKIYINDSTEPLEEDYLPEEWVWKNDGYTFVVPEDCYLCLGDNRNNSHDARSWTNTYVTKDAILGQAILCYWPTDDIGWLN